MSKALVIDYKYCNGCNSCVLACRNEKELGELQSGIRVAEFGPEKIHGKWYWNFVPVPNDYCDLCEGRRTEGKKAACEQHCLSQCMFVVDIEEVGAKLAELGGTATCFIP